MARREIRCGTGEHRADRVFVQARIPGDRQAYGQSSCAVVVVRTPHPHDLGGHRIDRRQPHGRRRATPDSAPQCQIGRRRRSLDRLATRQPTESARHQPPCPGCALRSLRRSPTTSQFALGTAPAVAVRSQPMPHPWLPSAAREHRRARVSRCRAHDRSPRLLSASPVCPLVVRGAVPLPVRFPIPLSSRACGFPAHGLRSVFLAWLRSLRVADGVELPLSASAPTRTGLTPAGLIQLSRRNM